MKPRIYFHIDEYNRDSIVASALKYYFKHLGYNLVYGARYLTESVLPRCLDAFDAIILPKSHFIRLPEKYESYKGRVFCLMTESIGWQMSDSELAAYVILTDYNDKSTCSSLIDTYYLWGKIGLDAIAKNAPEYLTRCEIIGHPRYDRLCWNNKKSEAIEENHCDLDKTLRVGLLTRFPALNDFAGRRPFGFRRSKPFGRNDSGLYSGSLRPEPADDIYAEAIEMGLLIEIIERLALIDHNISIEFRVHPREDSKRWSDYFSEKTDLEEKILFVEPSTQFSDWASGLDYLIGPPSTTFYEAFVLGVTPISIHLLDSRRSALELFMCEDRTSIMKHVFSPASMPELIEFIASGAKLSLNRDVERILYDEMNYPWCSSSLEKMADSIDEKIKKQREVSAFDIYRSRVEFLWRKFFLNIWFSVLVKLTRFRLQSASFILTRRVEMVIDDLSKKYR